MESGECAVGRQSEQTRWQTPCSHYKYIGLTELQMENVAQVHENTHKGTEGSKHTRRAIRKYQAWESFIGYRQSKLAKAVCQELLIKEHVKSVRLMSVKLQ